MIRTLSVDFDKKPRTPRAAVRRNARFDSVAYERFDRKSEWFEGLCPVVKAPFATLATSSTGGAAALTSG